MTSAVFPNPSPLECADSAGHSHMHGQEAGILSSG